MKQTTLFALMSAVCVVSLGAAAQPVAAPAIANKPKNDAACKKILESANGCNASASLTTVLAMLFKQDVAGGKRLGEEIPQGMPSGLVMPRGGNLSFDAQAVAAEGLVSLRIQGAKLNIELRQASASGVYAVPAASFAAGAEYRWTLTTRKKAYTAEFTLPDDAKRQQTEGRIAALAAFDLDEVTRLTFEAAIYDEEDFDSTRDALVNEIRKRSGR